MTTKFEELKEAYEKSYIRFYNICEKKEIIFASISTPLDEEIKAIWQEYIAARDDCDDCYRELVKEDVNYGE